MRAEDYPSFGLGIKGGDDVCEFQSFTSQGIEIEKILPFYKFSVLPQYVKQIFFCFPVTLGTWISGTELTLLHKILEGSLLVKFRGVVFLAANKD